jgi:hypothetical protein
VARNEALDVLYQMINKTRRNNNILSIHCLENEVKMKWGANAAMVGG